MIDQRVDLKYFIVKKLSLFVLRCCLKNDDGHQKRGIAILLCILGPFFEAWEWRCTVMQKCHIVQNSKLRTFKQYFWCDLEFKIDTFLLKFEILSKYWSSITVHWLQIELLPFCFKMQLLGKWAGICQCYCQLQMWDEPKTFKRSLGIKHWAQE